MRPDRILAGKYRLVSKLTEGGMGMVWRAEHVELGTPAAVKLLDPTIAESSDALSRFRREAQSAASLRSSNIVQIFDFGVDGELPYIAMELLQGQSLSDKLRAERTLSPEETAAILSQVARATAWAHSRGIVHRDLKPGNIFLSDDAGSTIVKLLDFGIAKSPKFEVSEAFETLTGTIMGTPQYMSPEQASGQRQLDHRTDIWSFGIIAFECLTGRHAFHANTLGGLVLSICVEPMPVPSSLGRVPNGFDAWFARAAHRDLDARFGTMTEAAEQLRNVCGVDAPGSGRTYPYDNTLYSDGRITGNGHARIATGDSDLLRTTSAPSITMLPDATAKARRSRALWVSGSLIAIGVAIGAIGSARYTSTQDPSSSAPTILPSHPAQSPPPSPQKLLTDSSPPLVTPTSDPMPSQPSAQVRATIGASTASRSATSVMSNSTSLSKSLVPRASASTPVTMPSSELPPPPPVIKAPCDPAVKARIGFCPAVGK